MLSHWYMVSTSCQSHGEVLTWIRNPSGACSTI
jgi:hypothetical protein